LQQRDLSVEYVRARRYAGSEPVIDDALRVGCAPDRIVCGVDGRAADSELADAL